MSCIIISKIIEIKYLIKYFLRHLYYLSINRNLTNSKLNLFNNIKLYKKLFNTKISKLDILKNKEDNKIIKYYTLLKQQSEL